MQLRHIIQPLSAAILGICLFGGCDKVGTGISSVTPPAEVSDTTDTVAQRHRMPKMDPLRPWAHDPVITVQGDTTYVFTTGRGIHQMHSLNMKEWAFDGPCVETLPVWVKDHLPEATMHIWAPDIIYSGGKWHLFYCCSAFGKNTSVIGHLTNKTLNRLSAAYKWHDEGLILESVPHRDNWNAIDPNIMICADGSAWMSFGSFWGGIKLVRLKEDLGGIAEPQEWHSISVRQRSLNIENTNEAAGDAAVEAPFIFHRSGWYYLFVSFDYCCRGLESTYHIVVGRSRDIRGPYVDRNGTRMDLGGGSRLELPEIDKQRYVAAGHCAVATLHDKDYVVMHGYRRDEGFSELMVRRLSWTSEEWPIIQASETE